MFLFLRTQSGTPIQVSPSASPGLGMIQEEHNTNVNTDPLVTSTPPSVPALPTAPRISVTDECGEQVNLQNK